MKPLPQTTISSPKPADGGFLEDCCVIAIEPTASRADAVILERQREATGEYRYVGEVIVRRMEP